MALSERVCEASLTLAVSTTLLDQGDAGPTPCLGSCELRFREMGRGALHAGNSVSQGPEAGDREFGESRVWVGHGRCGPEQGGLAQPRHLQEAGWLWC